MNSSSITPASRSLRVTPSSLSPSVSIEDHPKFAEAVKEKINELTKQSILEVINKDVLNKTPQMMSAKKKMKIFMMVNDVTGHVLRELNPMIQEQKEIIKNAKAHDKKIIQFHNIVQDMNNEVRRCHVRINEFDGINDKIIACNYKLLQLQNTQASDKMIFENFQKVIEGKILTINQSNQVMDKTIANIAAVTERMEDRMDNQFKKYCVQYNERNDQKISQAIEQQNEIIDVLRNHMGDLDAKYKFFSEKIAAQMDSSISSIMQIHTDEQRALDMLKIQNKNIKQELSYVTSKVQSLAFPVDNLKDIPSYLQRSMPALQLTEISRFLKGVLTEETGGPWVQRNIIEYESKRMQEIIKANDNAGRFDMPKINEGVQYILKNLYKKETELGVIPFQFTTQGYKIDYDKVCQQETYIETYKAKIADVEKQIEKYDPKTKTVSLKQKLMEFDVHQRNKFKEHVISEKLKLKNLHPVLQSFITQEELSKTMIPVYQQLQNIQTGQKAKIVSRQPTSRRTSQVMQTNLNSEEKSQIQQHQQQQQYGNNNDIMPSQVQHYDQHQQQQVFSPQSQADFDFASHQYENQETPELQTYEAAPVTPQFYLVTSSKPQIHKQFKKQKRVFQQKYKFLKKQQNEHSKKIQELLLQMPDYSKMLQNIKIEEMQDNNNDDDFLEKQMQLNYYEKERPEILEQKLTWENVREMVNSMIDWQQNRLKLSFNSNIAFIKQQYIQQKAELAEYQSKNEEMQRIVAQTLAQNTEFEKKIEQNYKVDKNQLIQYRNRLKSDLDNDFTKIIQISEKMTTKVDTSLVSEARNKEKIQQILGYLVTKKTLENETEDIIRYNDLLYKREELQNIMENFLLEASKIVDIGPKLDTITKKFKFNFGQKILNEIQNQRNLASQKNSQSPSPKEGPFEAAAEPQKTEKQLQIEAKTNQNSGLAIQFSDNFKNNEVHRQSLQSQIWNSILEEHKNYIDNTGGDLIKQHTDKYFQNNIIKKSVRYSSIENLKSSDQSLVVRSIPGETNNHTILYTDHSSKIRKLSQSGFRTYHKIKRQNLKSNLVVQQIGRPHTSCQVGKTRDKQEHIIYESQDSSQHASKIQISIRQKHSKPKSPISQEIGKKQLVKGGSLHLRGNLTRNSNEIFNFSGLNSNLEIKGDLFLKK